MAFPTTSVIDNFNRADEGPPPSASWSNDNANGWRVVSNQCATDTLVPDGYALSYYNGATYGPDYELYCVLITKPALTVLFELCAADGSFSGYCIRLISGAGTDTVTLRRYDLGTSTQLASYTPIVANGDSIGFSKSGSTITAYHKPSAGSWTALGSVNDSTYNTIATFNINTESAITVIDDFSGGTLSSTKFRKTFSYIGTGTGKRQSRSDN